MSSLPSALAARGHKVMTVSPLYYQPHGQSSIPHDMHHSGVFVPVRLATRPESSRDTGHDREGSGSRATTSGRSSIGHSSAPSHHDRTRFKGCSNGSHRQSIPIRQVASRTEAFRARRREEAAKNHPHSRSPKDGPLRPFSIFSSSSDSHLSKPNQRNIVGYYSIRKDGVDHVFVDHEIFSRSLLSGGGGDITHPSMMTYTEGRDENDIDIQERCSVLCQAALAAPVVMWQPSSFEIDESIQGSIGGRSRDPFTLDPFTLVDGLGRQTNCSKLGKRRSALDSAIARLESQADPTHPSHDRHKDLNPPATYESQPPVVFVANDWPTGLLPLWLDAYQKEEARAKRFKEGKKMLRDSLARFQSLVASQLNDSKFVFAIHNFGFHGVFSSDTFKHLGLPFSHKSLFSTPSSDPLSLLKSKAKNRSLNWIQAALLSCDIALTVSPTHAEELKVAAIKALTLGTPQIVSSSSSPSSPSSSSSLVTGGPSQSPELASALLLPGRSILKRSKWFQKDSNQAIDLIGILNGIDTSGTWNPFKDPLLPPELWFTQSTEGDGIDSIVEAKARAKRHLQKRFGMKVDPSVPLFAFIGRLEEQKGVDVLLSALISLLGPPSPLKKDKADTKEEERGQPLDISVTTDEEAVATKGKDRLSSALASSFLPLAEGRRRLVSAQDETGVSHQQQAIVQPLQLVMLGKGQLWMEKAISLLPSLYPGSAAGVAGVHDEELAHLFLAASDFIVMPSRYEPCGLVAMCGQRYGAVPIVSPVGGLVDIVSGEGRGEGERAGYMMKERPGAAEDSFSNRIAAADLSRTMMMAACEYRMKDGSFEGRRRRCLERDSSWERAGREWEEKLLALSKSDEE